MHNDPSYNVIEYTDWISLKYEQNMFQRRERPTFWFIINQLNEMFYFQIDEFKANPILFYSLLSGFIFLSDLCRLKRFTKVRKFCLAIRCCYTKGSESKPNKAKIKRRPFCIELG